MLQVADLYGNAGLAQPLQYTAQRKFNVPMKGQP
jgi:hypothetical protein